MPVIKSLDDLKKVREAALERRKIQSQSGQIEGIVGMGTCGIAAGARDTMKAILEKIQAENLEGIVVKQTGCIGVCEKEPIVQVVIGEEPKVTYGKVSAAVAQQIIDEHVRNGKPLQSHVINI
ncbi:MAG TPA: (2Fe-2S) ferredoxin domain-containing protein [Bellilinea sp.]|nr:(2Fe-2S) ferredoxin domain-containing protein [Bellilinea sp.]